MEKIKLTEEALQYKGVVKWHSIPFAQIRQVYMRIEEARATIGCCPHFFETPYLMVRTDEKLYQILCDSKDKVKENMARIQEKNPQVSVGYHREDQKKK